VSVLKFLYRIVDKSEIKKVLENEKNGVVNANLSAFASSELYQWFGYFAIIGLCRVHVITGDYYLAVKTLDPIDIEQKKVRYAKITGAYITIHYYLGFCYLMMRRYRDALKIFERVLLYISRMKQFHTRQYDQVRLVHLVWIRSWVSQYPFACLEEEREDVCSLGDSARLLPAPH